MTINNRQEDQTPSASKILLSATVCEYPNEGALALCNLENVGEVAEIQSLVASEHMDFSSALSLIAQRALKLTRASGTAIALREGNSVVCRARAGGAPDLGVEVNLDSSSLSGRCFRSGAMVMCDDIAEALQISPDRIGDLDFRSILVIPILAPNDQVVGILEALSKNPRNFLSNDVLSLSLLAETIQELTAGRETDSGCPEPVRNQNPPTRLTYGTNLRGQISSRKPLLGDAKGDVPSSEETGKSSLFSRISANLRRAFFG